MRSTIGSMPTLCECIAACLQQAKGYASCCRFARATGSYVERECYGEKGFRLSVTLFCGAPRSPPDPHGDCTRLEVGTGWASSVRPLVAGPGSDGKKACFELVAIPDCVAETTRKDGGSNECQSLGWQGVSGERLSVFAAFALCLNLIVTSLLSEVRPGLQLRRTPSRSLARCRHDRRRGIVSTTAGDHVTCRNSACIPDRWLKRLSPRLHLPQPEQLLEASAPIRACPEMQPFRPQAGSDVAHAVPASMRWPRHVATNARKTPGIIGMCNIVTKAASASFATSRFFVSFKENSGLQRLIVGRYFICKMPLRAQPTSWFHLAQSGTWRRLSGMAIRE